eukprot:129053-Hanusia_phi.AAC.1
MKGERFSGRTSGCQSHIGCDIAECCCLVHLLLHSVDWKVSSSCISPVSAFTATTASGCLDKAPSRHTVRFVTDAIRTNIRERRIRGGKIRGGKIRGGKKDGNQRRTRGCCDP